MANSLSTRNYGTLSTDGLATTTVLAGNYLATVLGIPNAPELFASDGSTHGWNSITLTMASLTGPKTWGVDISIGGAGWTTLKSGLANGDFVTIGPQGITTCVSGTLSYGAGMRPAAVRLTLSATDSAGVLSFLLESRNL